MRYHNITKDDMLNGDGLRVVLWVSGCDHCCKECHNPITWDPNGGLVFDKEAKEELDRISQDDLLRRRVLNRTLEIADQLQMKKELEEARKKLEEAKKEAQQAENEKEDIIKNLHKLNIPIEQISKAVNLSEKEIKEILSTHSYN